MAEPTLALLEYLRKSGIDMDADFLREGIQLLTKMLMELEVSQQIGADRYQRSDDRQTYRNGYRERNWQTRVGDIPLSIPKLREGTYFPGFLEPRRRAEKALLAVIQTAYVEGVSTRRVDDLVQAMGLTGIDKSAVSRICKELDTIVHSFRNRSLQGNYPYVWLDAVYVKVRQNHRIVSMAVVVAIGVKESGERSILGLEIGASEEGSFWTEFLRSLVSRGLRGVELVISDAHTGLQEAIPKVLAGSAWQRCRVHFTRNILAHIPQRDKAMVAAAIRTIFAQPNGETAHQQTAEVVKVMEPRWPQAATVLATGAQDALTYMSFPMEHWTRIFSTNPLERLNREIKRRTEVVGVFPDTASVIRLVGSVLIEIDDEWQEERRYFSLELMEKLKTPTDQVQELLSPLRLAPIR